MGQMQLMDFNDYRMEKKYVDGVFKSKEELVEIAKSEGRTRVFKVLSFGGGTQSSHILELHLRKEKGYEYDAIVFSDLGAEPYFILNQVKFWQERQKQYGNTTPFIITHHSHMERGLEEMLFRYMFTDYNRFQMPLYFKKIDYKGEVVPGGLMPRQCTAEFKIQPAQKAVRDYLKDTFGEESNEKLENGVRVENQEETKKKRKLFPKTWAIIFDIGFSYTELNRVNTYRSPQSSYIYLGYPLVEAGHSTEDSINFLIENNLPTKRSRCYFCPFNCSGDRAKEIGMDWLEIVEDEPFSFLKACYFDDKLREVQATGRKAMTSIPYFHFSRTPLKEVYAAQYEILNARYKEDLIAWEKEWFSYLLNKYFKEDLAA
jgi:hypothetical protein